MFGFQIINLDEESLELYPFSMNVPDIIEDIFPMISSMEIFWFLALVELSASCYSFQQIIFLLDVLLWFLMPFVYEILPI